MTKITTVIFDVYETLAHNDVGEWIDTFGRISRVQDLGMDPEHLYQELKALEMVFRKERLNLEEPEKSPPFKSYEEAWRDCFDQVFSRLGLAGDAVAAAKEAVRDMGMREPYQDAVEALGDQFQRSPIGTGPFMFAEYQPQQYVKLVANEDYFRGAPKI